MTADSGKHLERPVRSSAVAMAISLLTMSCLVVVTCSCSSHWSNPSLGQSQLDSDNPIPEDVYIRRVEPWEFVHPGGSANGELLITQHYRIHTTEVSPLILRRLPAFAELSLDHYRTALGDLPSPRRKLDTFVMRTRSEWDALTIQMLGEQAGPFLRIRRGGYSWAGNAVLYSMGQQETMAIMAHEGWHQYVQRTFEDAIPIWLDEGIACFMEGHRWGGRTGGTPRFAGWANVDRFDALRNAASLGWDRGSGGLWSLDELLHSAPGDLLRTIVDHASGVETQTYYAQVWALVHFLREGAGGRYREALTTLLQEAASGQLRHRLLDRVGRREAFSSTASRRGTAVFRAYFNDDLEEAEREYRAFIMSVIAPGGREAVTMGDSPLKR